MKQIHSFEIPFRPAYEFRAVFGWALAVAWFAWELTQTAEKTPQMAIPLWVAIAVSAFFLFARLGKGVGVILRRRKLADGHLEFISLEELKKKVERWSRSKVHDGRLWIGLGFIWTREVAERAYDLMRRGIEDIIGRSKAKKTPSLWIHGIGFGEEELFQEENHRKGHTLIVGTTGSGKTRLLDLVIAQDILRGECVIIIDPKGDRELAENARRVCEMLGCPERFAYFHPAFPERSVGLDPLKNWSRPTEIASRIASLIPSETGADPFTAFGWMALNDVIEGMLAVESQPTLTTIRRFIEGGLDDLLVRALRKHFEEKVPGWEEKVAPYLKKFKGNEAQAYMELVKKDLPPDQSPSHLHGLIRTCEHNREHYQKMIASLMPILSMLTSAPLGELLSPSSEGDRQFVNSAGIIEKGMVLYVGLDSLSDATVGSAIGSIILADLTAVAGDRYNYGKNLRPVNIYVDEAAEVINKPTIQLLNKGRGAGFRMTIATQTIADFVARLGDEAQARQVLGNLNNKHILRVTDGETQKYLVESMAKAFVTTLEQQLRSGTSSQSVDEVNSMVGETMKQEELELIPPYLLGQLPDLHFFSVFANGQVVKSRIPIVTG